MILLKQIHSRLQLEVGIHYLFQSNIFVHYSISEYSFEAFECRALFLERVVLPWWQVDIYYGNALTGGQDEFSVQRVFVAR